MIEGVRFPDGNDDTRAASTPEEREFLRRLEEYGETMRKDYGVAKIEWWTTAPPEAGLWMKSTMPDGVYFQAAVNPIMFAQLLTDGPLNDFFEHMHRELTLRVDEWKRGMYEPKEPDIREHILAFREWNVNWDTMSLGAIGVSHIWQKGADWQKAECQAQGRYANAPFGHTAPHPQCHCGFYGWWNFRDHPDGYAQSAKPGKVWGVVQAKGRIEVHSDGIRAEYIRPVMLAVPEATSFFMPNDPSDPIKGGSVILEPRPGALPIEPEGAKDVRALAKAHGLDAVSWGYVLTKASEYGVLVPEHLRPSA